MRGLLLNSATKKNNYGMTAELLRNDIESCILQEQQTNGQFLSYYVISEDLGRQVGESPIRRVRLRTVCCGDLLSFNTSVMQQTQRQELLEFKTPEEVADDLFILLTFAQESGQFSPVDISSKMLTIHLLTKTIYSPNPSQYGTKNA